MLKDAEVADTRVELYGLYGRLTPPPFGTWFFFMFYLKWQCAHA